METNDPNAQGTQAAGNEAGAANPNAQETFQAGIQKRIDEITAKAGNWERQAQANQQTIAEQQAVIAQLMSRGQNQPESREAAPEIDPEDQKKFGYLLDKALAPFKQQLNQISAGLVQTRVQPQMQSVQEKLNLLNNPEITSKVNALIAGWQRNGTLQNGTYTPEDALNVAVGQFGLGQLLKGAAATQSREAFNNGFLPVAGQPGSTRSAAAAAVPVKKEKDLLEMTQDELAATVADIEKRNPDGFGM